MYGRPKAIIGAPPLKRLDRLRERAARLADVYAGRRGASCGPSCRRAMSASGGKDCVEVDRGRCRAPGRRIVRRRSRTVGSASAANGRELRRGTGRASRDRLRRLDQRVDVVERARRFTNVVLARRMKAGSRPIDSASASFWLPSARVVSLRLPISAARSSRRSASAVTSRELSTRKRSSTGGVAVSSLNSRLEVDSAGFRYWKPTLACVAAPRELARPALEEALERLARRRVERVEELVEVDRGGGLVGVDRRRRPGSCRPRRCGGQRAGRRSGWRCPTARPGGSSARVPRRSGA